jgi:hypothetical protein
MDLRSAIADCGCWFIRGTVHTEFECHEVDPCICKRAVLHRSVMKCCFHSAVDGNLKPSQPGGHALDPWSPLQFLHFALSLYFVERLL